jgi:hypothetical protein
VGEDRSTSPRLPEVLPALAEFTGMTGFTGMAVQAAGRQPSTAYDAVIVSS